MSLRQRYMEISGPAVFCAPRWPRRSSAVFRSNGRLLDNDVGRGYVGADADHVFDGPLHAADGNGVVHNILIGGQALDHALDLSDVRRDVLGNVIHDLVVERQAELRGLVADDGHARFHVRRLHGR